LQVAQTQAAEHAADRAVQTAREVRARAGSVVL
jgi:hypothetical protein